jgi:hypothetical protein
MKAQMGIKQQLSNKGSGGKTAIPEDDNLEDGENTNPLPSASANSQSHALDLQDRAHCQLTFPSHPTTFSGYGNATVNFVEGVLWDSTPLDPSLDPAFMVPPTSILQNLNSYQNW